ncbi:MAG: prepilin-type N-terminal cleavage/methylation domain-containing protein [Opitutaceae bacterium]|nr:prepilin-type N-terminal cleavage/methylation domain-containing protein [Opitutaceae bacterium]
MKAFPQRTRGAGAFTLIELIVALSIGGLLIALTSPIALQVAEVWKRTSGRLATSAQAEIIFDRIARDLESAVFRRDGNVWFVATYQASPQKGRGDSGVSDATWDGRVKPSFEHQGDPSSSLHTASESEQFSRSRFGQSGIWLRFFTVQPDTQSELHDLSAPRAVAYQIVRRRATASASASVSSNTPTRYFLYRSAVRPASENLQDVDSTFSAGYDLFSSMSPGYNQGDASRIDNVGNIRTPRRYEQVIGNNVIDFGVRCWVRDEVSGELFERFPLRNPGGTPVRGFAATVRDGIFRAAAVPPVVSAEPSLGATEMSYGFPERVDVFLRILTDEGARIVDAFEQGRAGGFEDQGDENARWWSLAIRHSHVYVASVRIFAHAL